MCYFIGKMNFCYNTLFKAIILLFLLLSSSLAQDQPITTTVKKDDVTSEVACAIKDYSPKDAKDLCLSCTEKSWKDASKSDAATSSTKVIEVAILSTGKSTEFRHWEPQDITLIADGEKIRPCGKDKFYVPKESAVKDIATATFVVLGSQDPASSCHEDDGRGKTAKAIDRAGMAAGLGLLTSQSKGEITGLKARFKLPSSPDKLNSAKIEANLLNTDTQKKMNIDAKAQFAALNYSGASNALPTETFNIAR